MIKGDIAASHWQMNEIVVSTLANYKVKREGRVLDPGELTRFTVLGAKHCHDDNDDDEFACKMDANVFFVGGAEYEEYEENDDNGLYPPSIIDDPYYQVHHKYSPIEGRHHFKE